jgi:hypothetical protein
VKRRITVTIEIETERTLPQQSNRLREALERAFFDVKVIHILNEPINLPPPGDAT